MTFLRRSAALLLALLLALTLAAALAAGFAHALPPCDAQSTPAPRAAPAAPHAPLSAEDERLWLRLRDRVARTADERLAAALTEAADADPGPPRAAVAGGPVRTFGGAAVAAAIAKVVWRAVKAVVLLALADVLWSHWHYVAAAAAALLGFVRVTAARAGAEAGRTAAGGK